MPESNVFELDHYRRRGTAGDQLPTTGAEFRDQLAHVMDALDQQPATTQLEQARQESGLAALRLALHYAQRIP